MDSSAKDNEFISKFDVKNKPLYVKVLWTEDGSELFHIKTFYEDNSWTGKYANELADKRRQRLDETLEEYIKNVKECLSGNSKGYVYDFTLNSDDINVANFTWKKRYEGALIVHGVVSLQRDEVPTSKDTLIDRLLEQNRKLISDIEVMKKANNRLTNDLEQYKDKLLEVIKTKDTLETTLYGQFVRVLNEKKERIQLLKEHLKKYEQ